MVEETEERWSVGEDAYRPTTLQRRRRVVQITVGFADLPRKRVVYDRRHGELVELGLDSDVKDAPSSAFRADVIDSDLATRTLFVEHEDGMLCGAVAEVADAHVAEVVADARAACRGAADSVWEARLAPDGDCRGARNRAGERGLGERAARAAGGVARGGCGAARRARAGARHTARRER